MTAQAKQDDVYRAWIGHLYACATCRAGAACSTATRLGRAWRKTRR